MAAATLASGILFHHQSLVERFLGWLTRFGADGGSAGDRDFALYYARSRGF